MVDLERAQASAGFFTPVICFGRWLLGVSPAGSAGNDADGKRAGEVP
jgi:hypothetical protein